ncbi:MAG: phosphatidate cytidylyltransferase [Beijerinckiaceae bacterium]|nr:phosphatidate cytidylyltransferase [Beijerinckiaceae bacterium]
MVAAAAAVTVFGGWAFKLFWTVAAFACAYEWFLISAGGFTPLQYVAVLVSLLLVAEPPPYPLASAAVMLGLLLLTTFLGAPQKRIWAGAGVVYACGLLFGLVALRGSTDYGLIVVFWLFAIVWASDIAAYFTGRAIGGPKLMPRVSPKKTWSGFLGGTAGGALAGTLTLLAAGQGAGWQHMALAAALSVASAAGDLLESAFKRHFGVKDSGRFIPGHGGALDRLDGFIAAVICAVIIGYARNGDPARGLLAW